MNIIFILLIILFVIFGAILSVTGYKYNTEGDAFLDCVKSDPIGCVVNPNISTDCDKYGKKTPMDCFDDQIKKYGKCYKKSDVKSYVFSKKDEVKQICPEGTIPEGPNCKYNRGDFSSKIKCDKPYILKGDKCYQQPGSGKEWVYKTKVSDICPKGTTVSKDKLKCLYTRPSGKNTKLGCGDRSDVVQKGVECYKKPSSGWDWTTPGGLLVGKKCEKSVMVNNKQLGITEFPTHCQVDRGIGVPFHLKCSEGEDIKGVECWKKPPTGWGWTTPGGLLIGKKCPKGSNDSGITCWYDRGVGKIPLKRPCNYWGNNGWRDDGTSCWNDAHIYGKGCCCTAFTPHCCRNCKRGYWDDGCTCRKTGVGIKKTLGQRWYCHPDEELVDGLCYKKPKPGYKCTATNCSFSKNVKPGKRVGIATEHCYSDKPKLEAGLCYRDRPSGYGGTGPVLLKDRNVKPGQKVGNIYETCDNPALVKEKNGKCYNKPKTNFACNETNCTLTRNITDGIVSGNAKVYCDPGEKLINGNCYSLGKDGFTCKEDVCLKGRKTKQIKGVDPSSCPYNTEKFRGSCYDKCPDNGKRIGKCSCKK